MSDDPDAQSSSLVSADPAAGADDSTRCETSASGDVVETASDDVNITAASRRSIPRRAAALVSSIVVVLAILTGWMAYRADESHRAQQDQALFVRAGRQAAVNLTTINYAEADGDVQRILGTAAGSFYDEFRKRAPAFVDVVKQAQSKSEGSVTEAGLESMHGAVGRVLVAVSVSSSLAGTPAQQRNWRMRMDIEKAGDSTKVVKVEFVP